MVRSPQPAEVHHRPASGHARCRLRAALRAVLLAVPLLAWGPLGAAAQQLPLKRDTGAEPFRCPADPPGGAPEEARRQAADLGRSATQAVILGDRERARELLARATELDPGAADLAYRYARVLEDGGAHSDALIHYCRTVALDSLAVDAADARNRIEELAAALRPDISPAAIASFRAGVSSVDAGRLEEALRFFGQAVEAVPGWAEAVYDRGVVHARLERRAEAAADLRRYLELRPDGGDAIVVSERIGALRSPESAPSPGTALTLGVVLPGMGQFYSGRTLGGLTVLSLVGGSIAAALLVEDVEIRCLADPGPDGTCPAGQVLGQTVERPYLVPGLGVAAAVSVLGAVEAFLRLRGRGASRGGLVTAAVGSVRVEALDVAPSPRGVDVRLVHLRF